MNLSSQVTTFLLECLVKLDYLHYVVRKWHKKEGEGLSCVLCKLTGGTSREL